MRGPPWGRLDIPHQRRRRRGETRVWIDARCPAGCVAVGIQVTGQHGHEHRRWIVDAWTEPGDYYCPACSARLVPTRIRIEPPLQQLG